MAPKMVKRPPAELDGDGGDVAIRIPRPPRGPVHPGKLPIRLFQIIHLLLKAFQIPEGDHAFYNVDHFSGQGSVARGFKGRGHKVARLDIALNKDDDILTPHGFVKHLLSVLCLAVCGLLSTAPVCGTWTLINRGTSGRSKTSPMGRMHVPSVQAANLMISRVTLLLMVAVYRGCHFMLENPLQSLVQLHDRLKVFFASLPIHEVHTSMGMFGGGSQKPTKLFSNDPFVMQLYRRFDRSQLVGGGPGGPTTVRYQNALGVWRFHGGPGLKSTQVYPPSFGREVARNFDLYASKICQPDTLVDYSVDPWDDAKLHEVEEYLHQLFLKRQRERKACKRSHQI